MAYEACDAVFLEGEVGPIHLISNMQVSQSENTFATKLYSIIRYTLYCTRMYECEHMVETFRLRRLMLKHSMNCNEYVATGDNLGWLMQ